MKFKLGLFLLIAIPLGASFIFFQHSSAGEGTQSIATKYYPYIIEEEFPILPSKSTSGTSKSFDPKTIAAELGVAFFEIDKFEAFPDPRLGLGSRIILRHAPEFTVIDGKKTLQVRSWKSDVGSLLVEQGIILGDDDRINFSPDTAIEHNMVIKIVRVAITNVKENEAIDYKMTKKKDNTLDEGKTRVEQKGVKGVKTYTYEVRREDGEEVARKLIKTGVTKEPIEEILIIGTKPVITVSCGGRSDIKNWILEAGTKYGVKPNSICCLMMKESRGNPNSGGAYKGLFQYDEGYWQSASSGAGYSGASIYDAEAQIFTTARELSRGQEKRWPPYSSCPR